MDVVTLGALRGSIEKWRRIVVGTDEDRGASNCPLCHEFLAKSCRGCPVRERTGKMFCWGTPYGEYSDLTDEEERSPLGRALAKAELEFLQSLLPPTEEPG